MVSHGSTEASTSVKSLGRVPVSESQKQQLGPVSDYLALGSGQGQKREFVEARAVVGVGGS